MTCLVGAAQTAEARLAAAERLLGGSQGAGQLAGLRAKLVARRCRMVTQLAAACELSFRTGETGRAFIGRLIPCPGVTRPT